MTYVVDASVVLKWFLPEPGSDAADTLLERFLNDEVDLIAPDLLLLEAANALWKRVHVRGELTAQEAMVIYRDLLTLPLMLIPVTSLGDLALQWALQLKHSAHDSLYCALAAQRHCEFVTADQVLVNKLNPVFPWIRYLTAITP